MADAPHMPYVVVKVEGRFSKSPDEYDVWRDYNDRERRLMATYAFVHQATEVADVLNKWAAAEL